MEIAEPVDMVENLLSLPEEIRCLVIGNYGFSLSDVQRISLVSTQLRQNMRSCLRYLHVEPIHTVVIAEEEHTFGGDVYNIQPGYIQLYPQLVESEYPITITSLQDLQLVASHPHLKHAILDMQPFYRSLLGQYREEEESAGEEGEVEWQFSGVDITVIRKGAPQTLTFTTVSAALLFFLFEYRYMHPQHRLTGTKFTFLLPGLGVTYQPSNLCLLATEVIHLDPAIWDVDEILREIERIDHIRRYAGPWPLPEATTFEELCLYIDDGSYLVMFDQDDASYVIRGSLIAEIFTKRPNLRRFGIYMNRNSYIADDAMITFNFLRDLEKTNRVFSNIQVLDYPVHVDELPLLQSIFPNVREPLLDGFIKLSPEEREILQKSRGFFTAFRLLPGINYPQEVTNNFTTYVDATNFTSMYPC